MRYTIDTRKSPTFTLVRVFGAVGITLALLLAAAAPASAAPPAQAPAQSPAQIVCATHAEVAKRLDSGYSETPTAIGLASNGAVIELFSTTDGSTWTLVMTLPDGTSCTMAAGESWETFAKIALGPQA